MPVSDKWASRVLKVSQACVDFGTTLLTRKNGEAAEALDNMKTLLKDGVGTLKLCQTGLALLSATVSESIKIEFQEAKAVELVGTKAWMFKNKSYGLIWICKDFSELCVQADDAVSEAAAALLLAKIHTTRMNESDAPAAVIKQARKAIKLFQALGDAAGEAESLTLLMDGNTLLATISPFKEVQERCFKEAVETASEALELCDKANSTVLKVKVQCSLANAHMCFQDRENLNAAEAAAEAAVALARKSKDPPLEVFALEPLLRVRAKLEGQNEVERIADESARRWKRQGSNVQLAWAKHKALEAVVAMGDFENAEQRAQELQQLYLQVNDFKGQADTHKLLSQCHTAKKETGEAIEQLKEASELYQKCEDKRSEALALISIIDLSTQGLSLEVLADCWTKFTSGKNAGKRYDGPNAEDFRTGDEAVRMMEQAKLIFKEIGDQDGKQYVDQLYQANLDNATEAYTQAKAPDVEAVKVNPVDWKTESKICIWNITMPRMMDMAATDEEKEQAVFRVQRER